MFSTRRAPLAIVPDAPATFAEQALGHVDELYSLARQLSPQDAEDLVQDTYARAFAGRFDGENLRAWLFRILRNCFIDQARRKKIVLEIPDDTLEATHFDPQALDQLRTITANEITAALAALPVEYRFVVMLDLEGFSEAECADILRCPAGTVKSRLSRAKARLRTILKESR